MVPSEILLLRCWQKLQVNEKGSKWKDVSEILNHQKSWSYLYACQGVALPLAALALQLEKA